MLSLPNIQLLINQNKCEEALSCLNSFICDNVDDDLAYFMRGRLYWRMQNYSAAVTDFETALTINPECDFKHALELARDVFDYFNPDLLNP